MGNKNNGQQAAAGGAVSKNNSILRSIPNPIILFRVVSYLPHAGRELKRSLEFLISTAAMRLTKLRPLSTGKARSEGFLPTSSSPRST